MEDLMLSRISPLLCLALVIAPPVNDTVAGNGRPEDPTRLEPIVEAAPALAPFQHVRFCLRYPRDCQSNSGKDQRIRSDPQVRSLLRSVNDRINRSIVPTAKEYSGNLAAGWAIAPRMGDCNDYAVTKRHELLQSGLPSSALRLSLGKTPTGIGHLVLIVVTTEGDLVLDNLTEVIRPWQFTDYQWLKIQSSVDPHFWSAVVSRQAHRDMPLRNL
jgi:predicted transglutaminase-like cysteine proteinase